jgi:enoyl-CoA hydratase/carnithine racemase
LPSCVRSRKNGEENSNLTGAIMTEHVKTEVAAGIMTLTLARPDKMNALSNAMYSAMSDGLERAEKDPAVRVVLFQGDGDSFTAGNDVADFSAQANGKDTSESQAHRFIGNLGKATRPLVAAVQGNAVVSAPRCCCIATSCFLPTPQS